MIYQLHFSLKNTKPLVWRRVQMPAEDATFGDLAAVCIGAMGWDNSHLHEFFDLDDPDVKRIGMILEEEDEDYLEDEDELLLSERFNLEGQVIGMDYDLGDSWEHHITLEAILDEESIAAPQIMNGANACPPDDIGGIPGYYTMVEALKDRNHEQHESFLDWLDFDEGETWDVSEFDIDEAQETILMYWTDEEIDMDEFMNELGIDDDSADWDNEDEEVE
ncbi:MAG: plasmid pRiA4b ORF-3 family protein [Bacteroidia bacterium]